MPPQDFVSEVSSSWAGDGLHSLVPVCSKGSSPLLTLQEACRRVETVGLKLELTSLPCVGQSLAAGQRRWTLNQALHQKGSSCFFKALGGHRPQLLKGYGLGVFPLLLLLASTWRNSVT